MSWSQNNEEEIILRYFGDFIGTFADLGSNDGITLSNTFALHLKGWIGTLVEPAPEAFKRLETNYLGSKDTLINAAVSDFNGEATLHDSGEHLGTGDVSLLSTLSDESKKRWSKESFNDVKVPVVNFATMLGISKIKTFDFISLDIEGAELTVLPQMDLNALGCKLLCVEFNGKEQEKYDSIVLPQGYKLIHKNGENLIYASI